MHPRTGMVRLRLGLFVSMLLALAACAAKGPCPLVDDAAREQVLSPASCAPDSLPHLSQPACEALTDIHILGHGAGRTAWKARIASPACLAVGLCDTPVVRKVGSDGWRVSQRLNDTKEAMITEAALMHKLQVQYGPAASAQFYGICCNADGTVSIVMELLKPLNLKDLQSSAGREHVRVYAESMANFTEGPLMIPDLKENSLGLNERGDVVNLDLGFVSMSRVPTADDRVRFANKTETCLLAAGRHENLLLEAGSQLVFGKGRYKTEDCKGAGPWPFMQRYCSPIKGGLLDRKGVLLAPVNGK